MRKFLTFFIAGLLFSTISFADGVWTTSSSNTKVSRSTSIFTEDFEGFTAGDNVVQTDVSGFWDTWSHAPGGNEDAVISADQNNTSGGANSMFVSGSNDMVLLLGNQTTGEFLIDFWYYIPTGKGGYVNIQHDEQMGVQWALEVMFDDNGTAKLSANGTDTQFNYPKDQWFKMTFNVSLENDQITFTSDGTDVLTWQFSLQADGTAGMNKLGGINFYAGAPSGQTAGYYVDDVSYIQTMAPVEHPEADLSATSFTTDGIGSQVLTISNSGGEDLTFETAISYDLGEKSPNLVNNDVFNNSKTVMLMNPTAKKINKPVHFNISKDNATITHFDGTAAGSLGWGGTDPVTAEASALFKYDAIKDYIGMTVSSVIIFANDAPQASSSSVKVYDGRDGIVYGPINLKTEQAFTPVAASQVEVTLDTPIPVTGKDLFVGWIFTQNPSEHCVSMDAAITDDANWTKTGPSWSEVTEATFGDFGIVAMLTGTPVQKWLSLDTYSGTIAAGLNQDIVLNFDVTNLTNGTYNASIILKTNDGDDNESYIDIPVTLDVAIGISDNDNIGIMIYPNPVNNNMLNITASENINNISATNIAGQTVLNTTLNAKSHKVDLSNLAKGIYLFNITTKNQIVTKKVIVE